MSFQSIWNSFQSYPISESLDKSYTEIHNCDASAICLNTNGSFACQCKSGFTGSGLECFNVNECQQGQHILKAWFPLVK